MTDDDGGVDNESTVVRVLTPEQAVQELIELPEGLIAITTNGSVRKALEKARKALAGSNDHGENGALEHDQARSKSGSHGLPAPGHRLAAEGTGGRCRRRDAPRAPGAGGGRPLRRVKRCRRAGCHEAEVKCLILLTKGWPTPIAWREAAPEKERSIPVAIQGH